VSFTTSLMESTYGNTHAEELIVIG